MKRRCQMANVSLVEEPQKIVQRMSFGYSRKKFGKVVDPVRAAANHTGMLLAMGAIETVAERSWKKLDENLRWLAEVAVSGEIGCSWCMDYGYFEGARTGIDPEKVRAIFNWRESEVYDDRERAVLEYAEAATRTPAVVEEQLVQKLHAHFDDEAIVELAGWVALENFRSRFNAGVGLVSEGFSDSCDLAPEPVRVHAG
jgi:alkylhydroperoxidase family enzyme